MAAPGHRDTRRAHPGKLSIPMGTGPRNLEHRRWRPGPPPAGASGNRRARIRFGVGDLPPDGPYGSPEPTCAPSRGRMAGTGAALIAAAARRSLHEERESSRATRIPRSACSRDGCAPAQATPGGPMRDRGARSGRSLRAGVVSSWSVGGFRAPDRRLIEEPQAVDLPTLDGGTHAKVPAPGQNPLIQGHIRNLHKEPALPSTIPGQGPGSDGPFAFAFDMESDSEHPPRDPIVPAQPCTTAMSGVGWTSGIDTLPRSGASSPDHL